MFRNQQSRQRQIKLDKQPGLPQIKMVDEMRQLTMSHPGATVELPFGDDVQTLILTVSRDTGQGSWLWMLYRDDGFSSSLVWSQLCNDHNYIHALIENSNPGLIKGRRMLEADTVPAAEPGKAFRKGSLEGGLKDIQISNLLQSIAMGTMTGRLEIISPNDTANIYFDSGTAIHATLRAAEGHEAILQLCAWQEGEFAFFNESVNVRPTITRKLTGLMMEGSTYTDHLTFLLSHGLTNDCFPIRLKEFDSAESFTKALKGSVECDMNLQMTIFTSISGKNTWAEIVRDLPAKKTEWVPPLFNLLSYGFIKFESQSSALIKKISQQKIDWSIVQTIEKSMLRADTNLYTFAALLYSLQQEYFRFESLRIPFSLVVFGYHERSDEEHSFIPLKSSAVSEMKDSVGRLKRKFDIMGHYGAFAYAIVLPVTNKASAERFASMLADCCASINVSDDYNKNAIVFRTKVLNIPEDCIELEALLEQASK